MFLDEDSPITIESNTLGFRRKSAPVRWETYRLGVIPRLGFALETGYVAVTPPFTIRAGDICALTMGPHPESVVNGARFVVLWRRRGAVGAGNGGKTILFKGVMLEVAPEEPWMTWQFPIDEVGGTTGSIIIRFSREFLPFRVPKKMAIYDITVSDAGSLQLEQARSFRALRIRNEQANFDAYYQHVMFQQAVDNQKPEPSDERCSATNATAPQPVALDMSQAPQPPSLPTLSVTHYSRARLVERIHLEPPPFGWRLGSRVRAFRAARTPGDATKVRVLSICSGAARIEAAMIRPLPADAVSLTLMDVNSNLLELARCSLASWGEVETIVSDINALDLQGREFDIVICVSALHHVVELEHVLGEIADALAEEGEFWSIGETLGRNGGRMWPLAYQVADNWFRELDDPYRLNRVTGVIDQKLPDLDYSIGCFEGIRCEQIEPVLLTYFKPVQVTKHNCIIHKLFSPSYADNYDMSMSGDRAIVETAIDLEVDLHSQGQFGTELNGIFTRR